MSDRQAENEQRVTPLELFFDLVVVFAITQVTGFLSHYPTWVDSCGACCCSARCGGPGQRTPG